MIFVLFSGKMIFLFPENMIIPPGRKTKDDLSRQKNTWKYDIFFKCSEKMEFSKKLHWNMIFLVLSGKMVFFPKTWYFSVGRKMKDDISQEIHRNMIFSVWTCSCHAPCQKNQEWSFPTKIHLKVIDILHWHSRKSPNNFLYFYGWPYRRFHILLFSEKNPGNSVYRIGVWLLLQFIRSEIFYNE